MNSVFLSGIVEEEPKTVSVEGTVPHVITNLTVSHRTIKGVEKREQYPISAWRAIAQRMLERVRVGSHVFIKGYLSQKQTAEGVFIEITVEEFLIANQFVASRPLRRTVRFKKENILTKQLVNPAPSGQSITIGHDNQADEEKQNDGYDKGR